MRRAIALLGLGLLGSATGSCGDDSPFHAASLSEFRAGSYSAVCDWAARCGGIGKSDLQSCYDAYGLLSDGPIDWQALANKGDIAFDAEAAGRCLASLAALPCSALPNLGSADCAAAAHGTLPAGAACTVDEQCGSGYCSSTIQGCGGTCTAFPATGASCAGTHQCGAGDTCDLVSTTCKTRLGTGGACVTSSDCIDGLACVPDAGGVKLACGAPGGAGATCRGIGDCAGGLYCDPATKKCAAQADSGASCSVVAQCKSGLACLGLGGSNKTGTCGAWLDAGAACNADSSAGCPSNMTCDGKVCVPQPGPGQPCNAITRCRGAAYCNAASSTCQPLIGYGATCTPQAGDNPCAVGTCEPTSKRCLVLCP